MRAAIILAAGKGVRMKSDLPKVFLSIAGKPMLSYVIDAVTGAGIDQVYLIVGYGADIIKEHYKDAGVAFVEQKERLGTGHAVAQAEPALKDFGGTVMVLAGDMPLISSKTIKDLISFHEGKRASATVLTAILDDPFGYGRIVRERDGGVSRIVEERDASAKEKKISEINTGVYCFDARALFSALKEVKADNDQKEYYLTDTIGILKSKGLPVFSFSAKNPLEALGINTKDDLERIEKMISSDI